MASADTLEAGIQNADLNYGYPSSAIQHSFPRQVKNAALYELTTNNTEKGQSLHETLQSPQVQNL